MEKELFARALAAADAGSLHATTEFFERICCGEDDDLELECSTYCIEGYAVVGGVVTDAAGRVTALVAEVRSDAGETWYAVSAGNGLAHDYAYQVKRVLEGALEGALK